MIKITPSLSINEADIQWAFICASGPGGQHVNKTATAVQLRLNVDQI
jgi:ribosome-associated protein